MERKLSITSRKIALATVAILPILPRRMQIGGIGIILPLSMLFFLLYLCIRRKMIKMNAYCILYFVLFFMLYLRDGSILEFGSLFLETFAIYWIISDGVRDQDTFQKCIRIIAIIAAILSILAIVETFTDTNVFDMITNSYVEKYGANGYRYGLTRARGPFTTSINYCMYTMFALGATSYGLLNSKKKIRKYWIVAWLLILTSAICTLSRAPMITVIITQVIIFYKAGAIFNLKTIIKYLLFLIGCIFAGYITDLSIIKSTINSLFAMFFAVFNSDIALTITNASNFGINAGGIGERVLLFSWVTEEITQTPVSFFFGKGVNTQFSRVVTSIFTKTSIENHYLAVLFNTGIFGLVLEIGIMIGIIIAIKKSGAIACKWENKINFDYIVLVTTIVYYFALFTFNVADDKRIFIVLIGLIIARKNIIRLQ